MVGLGFSKYLAMTLCTTRKPFIWHPVVTPASPKRLAGHLENPTENFQRSNNGFVRNQLSLFAHYSTKDTLTHLLFLVFIPYFRGVNATRDAVVGEAPTGPWGELWQLSGNWQLLSCDRQDPTKGRRTYVIYDDLKAARLEPAAARLDRFLVVVLSLSRM